MKKLINFYKRLSFFQGMAFAIAFTSFIGIAATVTGLSTFTPGTTISSAQMNTNFNILKTAIESTSSQTFVGVYDASVGVNPTAGNTGDYYVITTPGTIGGVAYALSDWIIFNGTTWGRIPSSSAITSVFGRTGAIAALKGDYALTKLADVDTTTIAPNVNDILKFNGTVWTPQADTTQPFAKTSLPSCSVGQVLKSSSGTLVCVTPAGFTGSNDKAVITDAAGNLLTTTTTGTEIGYLSGLTGPLPAALAAKENLIVGTTSNKFFRGDKTFAILDTSAVPENTNLYFTNARSLAVSLTGLAPTDAPISASDTILQAFNKSQGQLNNKLSLLGGTLSVGTINGIPAPINPDDAANKGYIDSMMSLNGQWAKNGANIFFPTGNVGIGTSSPGASLHVMGNALISGTVNISSDISTGGTVTTSPGSASVPVLRSTSSMSTGVFFPVPNTMGITVSGTEKIRIDSSGNVGIGTTTPSQTLTVNGTVSGTSAFITASDVRYKKEIVRIPDALEKLLSIDGVSYKFKSELFPEKKFSNRREMGVIAQTVEKVFPEAVSQDQKGFKSVAYTMLISPIIEAIREMNFKQKNLEEENKMLKSYLCAKDPNAPFCE